MKKALSPASAKAASPASAKSASPACAKAASLASAKAAVLSATALSAGVLTLISFALKGCGMLFRVYLSGRMGSAGLGLYQLLMSVYALFSVFAASGFTVAVSRLAAERLADPKRGKAAAVRVLCVSSVLACSIGCAAGGALYGSARFLAKSLIADFRTAPVLRILAYSMPFMSVSACLKGYFIAVGQIYKPSLAALFEQLAKIGVTVCIFETLCRGVKSSVSLCAGVVAGLTAGEALSCGFLLCLYLFFSKRPKGCAPPTESPLATAKSVASVTLPIAASSYVTNILHSAESVLIPAQFVRFGGDRQRALADFGAIRGMTIPMLFFPYAFLGALLSIQIPAVSRLNAAENRGERNALIRRTMELSAAFSIAAGGIFAFFPREISTAVYGSAECAESTRLLALVTPFMYMETMSDGLLKSIGRQNRTLLFSVVNSVFRIAAVLFFIPKTGASGYLWLLVVSNTLSFVLCYGALKKEARFKLSFGTKVLFPALCTVAGGLAARPVAGAGLPAGLTALLCCSVCAAVFLALYLPALKRRRA